MKIIIDECNGIGQGFLKDLGNYKSVDEWICKIVDKKSNFYPFDLIVCFNGEQHQIIKGSFLTDNAQEIINKVKKLPANMRRMPNDNLEIEADIFENELYIRMK